MKFGLKNNLTNIFRNIAAGFVAAIVLSACGGGGGSPGTTTENTGGSGGSSSSVAGGTMTVTLVDQSGNPANLVSGASVLTAKAKVMDLKGKPIVGVVVKFSTLDAALVGVSPASDLTDANGMATSTITAASIFAAGASTIKADAEIINPTDSTKKVALSGSANLKVGVAPQAAPTGITLVSYMPVDRSILIKGSIGASRSQTAQVTFKVIGNGQPVANQKVKFEFQPANADLTFASNSGVTGQGGEVTAIVNSGSTVTVAAVKVAVLDASGNPTSIAATSDQISVTNDTTSKFGISLSTDKFFLEAYDVDGMESKITARLTDKQGGQVTDGTVVTFTTDGGAITGTNNSAMCQTKDGACSVKLVGQNPRPISGIATVVASVQVDGVVQTTQIGIVMSGSLATFTGKFSLDPITSCDPQTITFNVADSRGNPMPEESKLTILASQNATGKIIGDTVKYGFSLTGGTTHQVEVTPGDKCVVDGAKDALGSITLLITTPWKIESSQVVIINYKAN